jgi:hypothetical protein
MSAFAEAIVARAQTHPSCTDCVGRVLSPEIFTFRKTDGSVVIWDVYRAIEFCSDGRQPREIDRETLRLIATLNETNSTHVDHVNPRIAGIFCRENTPEGERRAVLIDGSHRAARCYRESLPFFAFELTEQESKICQATTVACLARSMQSVAARLPRI